MFDIGKGRGASCFSGSWFRLGCTVGLQKQRYLCSPRREQKTRQGNSGCVQSTPHQTLLPDSGLGGCWGSGAIFHQAESGHKEQAPTEADDRSVSQQLLPFRGTPASSIPHTGIWAEESQELLCPGRDAFKQQQLSSSSRGGDGSWPSSPAPSVGSAECPEVCCTQPFPPKCQRGDDQEVEKRHVVISCFIPERAAAGAETVSGYVKSAASRLLSRAGLVVAFDGYHPRTLYGAFLSTPQRGGAWRCLSQPGHGARDLRCSPCAATCLQPFVRPVFAVERRSYLLPR